MMTFGCLTGHSTARAIGMGVRSLCRHPGKPKPDFTRCCAPELPSVQAKSVAGGYVSRSKFGRIPGEGRNGLYLMNQPASSGILHRAICRELAYLAPGSFRLDPERERHTDDRCNRTCENDNFEGADDAPRL